MAFAVPTVTDIQAQVWDRIVDTDSANRAFDSATMLRVMNYLYAGMKGVSDDRVWELNATTSGASQTLGARKILLTPIYIRRILQVFPTSGASSVTPTGRALARVEPWEIERMQVDDPTLVVDSSASSATVYAAWRAGTETPASVGKWYLALWRTTSTTLTYMLRVLQEPSLLDASVNTTPDLTAPGCYALASMTAAVGARLIGLPEEAIADIKASVPGEYAAVLKSVETELGLVRARRREQPA